MKTFWTALALLAVLGLRPALAYEDLFPRQPGPEKNQSKQRGQQQGKENSRTRQRGQQQGQANSQTRPWEVRPWEQQGQQNNQTRPWETRPWDPQQKATEDRRRVGRKARKERLEKKNEQIQEVDSQQDRGTQRRSRWQRHEMESERYNSTSVR
jgi:hypothetical protein